MPSFDRQLEWSFLLGEENGKGGGVGRPASGDRSGGRTEERQRGGGGEEGDGQRGKERLRWARSTFYKGAKQMGTGGALSNSN